MLCSIIVPTRDRSKFLEGMLNSLLKQALPQDQFELLVVDNGSMDKTKEVVHSFLPKFKNARYFYTEEPGLHVGRHKGLFEARTDILVYADDDIIATPTWLEGVVESFQDSEAVLVGGNNYPLFQAAPPWWLESMWKPDGLIRKCVPYLSILDFGQQCMEGNHYVWGCNFSIRKDVLLDAGGFHPDSMPENLIHFRGDGESHVTNFIIQKGYKSLFNPKASIHHIVPENRMSLEYFKRRALNQGISDSYSSIRYQGGIYLDNYNIFNRFKKSMLRFKERFIHVSRETYVSHLKVTQSLEYFRLLQEIHTSYYKGYAYHQKMAQENPSLLEWILKPYYY